jgi:hypothetical protein
VSSFKKAYQERHHRDRSDINNYTHWLMNVTEAINLLSSAKSDVRLDPQRNDANEQRSEDRTNPSQTEHQELMHSNVMRRDENCGSGTCRA